MENKDKDKDTGQLENEIKQIKNKKDVKKFIKDNHANFNEFTLESYLAHLLEKKQLVKARVIADSKLDQCYAYHIFAGRKKSPSRGKMLSIALAMKLDVDETQRLLYYSGNERLYAKNSWDSVMMFALEKHLSIKETNDLLNNLSEPTVLENDHEH